jgi:hypothetical protein
MQAVPPIESKSKVDIRIQTFRAFAPTDAGCDIGAQLNNDNNDRLSFAYNTLPYYVFPDEAFGFSVNTQFAQNFHGIFLDSCGTINGDNFTSEDKTAIFLNRMITTISCFLHASGQTHFKPLRYFTATLKNTPITGDFLNRKPDIAVVRLVNGNYPQKEKLQWNDVQALAEQTISEDPPARMADTIIDKNYLMFCAQPERNYIINLCIVKKGFFLIVSDHVGQIETDRLAFDQPSDVISLLRVVMGIAFLPDKWLGIDDTIIRRVNRTPFSDNFEKMYPVFQSTFIEPNLSVFYPRSDIGNPFAITTEEGECDFDTISIGDTTYKVVSLLFQSYALIGRATKVFLVKFPDGREGVLKDSFVTTDRSTEASILKDLTIPFGPELVNHCVFEDTNFFRRSLKIPAQNWEVRQKRRTVTFPAGVHISEFTSLWELMVAFLDVAVGMSCLVINSLCLF